jgi:hypothetical protein
MSCKCKNIIENFQGGVIPLSTTFLSPVYFSGDTYHNASIFSGGTNLLDLFCTKPCGVSADTNTFVIGGNFSGTTLTLIKNNLSTVSITGFTHGGTFTGNTSGYCIDDLYVKTLHSCSPLYINPNDEGNVIFGSSSGVTINVADERIGIGTDGLTNYKLWVKEVGTHCQGKIESSGSYARWIIDSQDTNDSILQFNEAGTRRWQIVVDGTDDGMKFTRSDITTGPITPALVITSGDSVGIGTDNPKKLLHVNGDTLIGGGLTVSGSTRLATIGGDTPQFNLGIDSSGYVVSASTITPIDVNITGGTYNPTTGCATFYPNSGASFNVCGFLTGYTDSYTDTATLSGTSIVFDNTTEGPNFYNVDLYPLISGFTGGYWTAGTGTNAVKLINNGGTAGGILAVSEGSGTTASGNYSHAEGWGNIASTTASHAEGLGNIASGKGSHAEGNSTTASGGASHAEGNITIASGSDSHAEGRGTSATTEASHAEGSATLASSTASHAEGSETKATGFASHTEGLGTIASGLASHAEGSETVAFGYCSHTEGSETTATGENTHAGGKGYDGNNPIIASGDTSFIHFKQYNGPPFLHTPGSFSDYSAILGGKNHFITKDSEGSVILGGDDTYISGGTYSTVIGGYENIIRGDMTNTTIIGGLYNEITNIDSARNNNTIIGAEESVINNTNASSIFGGRYNINSAPLGPFPVPYVNVIVGGEQNRIHGAFHSGIFAGGGTPIDGNVILSGVSRTAIVGGKRITGTTDDTVYVPKLNIGTVYTGTSLYNLGINSDGFVVTGTTGGGGGSGTFTGNTINTCITDLYVSDLYTCSGSSITTVHNSLTIDGHLAATSKSFEIDHPTKEGKKLIHGSLEGPEHGVYVRGELKDDNIIVLPDYWKGLVDENSISVQLTPIGRACIHYVDEITDYEVYVDCDDGLPHCYYFIQGERKDINKLQIEK